MKKKIFSIWSVLLILVVSIAVVVPGCDGGGADTYALTMAPNPADCGTATDLTGASSYAANATVNIKAVADPCCRFVDWTAPDGTFGNSTAAETTFIMPARDVTVTANFELTPLDHFKTYWADWPLEPPPQWEPPLPVDVQLKDQFVTINATVLGPWLFANPAEKMHGEVTTPISEPNNHLTFYLIEPWVPPRVWEVEVANQFGPSQLLLVGGPFYLAVPTQKGDHDPWECLDHFLVYDVLDYMGEYPMQDVYIKDQFFVEGAWTNMYAPEYFAVPAQKIHPPGSAPTPIVDDVHLVFYWLDGIEPLNMYNLPIINQFGEQYLDVYESEGNFLGVPSVKTNVDGPWPYGE